MPNRKTVESFVSLVELGKFDLAVELYYADDAGMAENPDPSRTGIGTFVNGEDAAMSQFERVEARHVGPVFIDGDNVVVRWKFEFTDSQGTRRTLDELAWQRWDGENIREQRSWFDPAQIAE